jgi:hypothetical protein
MLQICIKPAYLCHKYVLNPLFIYHLYPLYPLYPLYHQTQTHDTHDTHTYELHTHTHDTHTHESNTPPTQESRTRLLYSKRALIVDDSASNRKFVHRLLRSKIGVRDEAVNGREAVGMAKRAIEQVCVCVCVCVWGGSVCMCVCMYVCIP